VLFVISARLPEGVAGLSGFFSWLCFTLLVGCRRAGGWPAVNAGKRKAIETLENVSLTIRPLVCYLLAVQRGVAGRTCNSED